VPVVAHTTFDTCPRCHGRGLILHRPSSAKLVAAIYKVKGAGEDKQSAFTTNELRSLADRNPGGALAKLLKGYSAHSIGNTLAAIVEENRIFDGLALKLIGKEHRRSLWQLQRVV
jgi:Ribonuclease G/E